GPVLAAHGPHDHCDFFFRAEDGIRDGHVTGVCALPILAPTAALPLGEQSVESVDRVEPAVEGPSDAELVAEFEARLRAHPLISQVLVIVEGRPFASALVTLVRDQLEYWRLVNGRPLSMAPEEIAGDRDLLREVQGLVYEAN